MHTHTHTCLISIHLILKYLFYSTIVRMPLSYKIGQHRDNNNQNVNMNVIVTLIGNPLFFNSDNMSSTLLYKMSDFHRKLFQNIQQDTTTCINIKIKYGLTIFPKTTIDARATCNTWIILVNVLLIGSIFFLFFSFHLQT